MKVNKGNFISAVVSKGNEEGDVLASVGQQFRMGSGDSYPTGAVRENLYDGISCNLNEEKTSVCDE